MKNSRTKNTTLTAMSGAFRTLLGLLTTFASRTLFIHILGAEYLSLNGLFANILSLLSLAELGIGSAITFYLYRPIAEQDVDRIKKLMRFYKNCYRCVGGLIIGIGMLLVPVLPYIVNFETELPVNLYVVYILFLLNSGASYLLNAYKQSFLQANQMGYVLENINALFLVFGCAADILVLLLSRNFVAYLIVKLILTLLKNTWIGKRVDKQFPYLIGEAGNIPKEERKTFFKDIYNVLIFNLGDKLLNATDNIIISTMLGTINVGYYSNYYMITNQIKMFYGLVLNSFRAGVGDAIAQDGNRKYSLYRQLSLLNQFVSVFLVVELMQVFNSFINLWVGDVDGSYVLGQSVVLAIILSLYYDFSTGVVNLFREANGSFGTGRYVAIFTGVINIVLSIVLAIPFGLSGVLWATVISKYTVAVVPFVKEVGDRVFEGKGLRFVFDYFLNFIVLIGAVVFSQIVCKNLHMKGWPELFAEAALCAVVTTAYLLVIYSWKKEFKELLVRIKPLFGRHR